MINYHSNDLFTNTRLFHLQGRSVCLLGERDSPSEELKCLRSPL